MPAPESANSGAGSCVGSAPSMKMSTDASQPSRRLQSRLRSAAAAKMFAQRQPAHAPAPSAISLPSTQFSGSAPAAAHVGSSTHAPQPDPEMQGHKADAAELASGSPQVEQTWQSAATPAQKMVATPSSQAELEACMVAPQQGKVAASFALEPTLHVAGSMCADAAAETMADTEQHSATQLSQEALARQGRLATADSAAGDVATCAAPGLLWLRAALAFPGVGMAALLQRSKWTLLFVR